MNSSQVQELQFELMKKASFNSFNGYQVVKDLIENYELWNGCLMINGDIHGISLTNLIYMSDNVWHLTTLFILSTQKNDQKLKELAQKWHANEIWFLSSEEEKKAMGTSDPLGNVLRIWWD